MGNFSSCFCSKPQTAKLIDVNGNQRELKLPITAAEVMLLEQPGHLISPVADGLRSNFRLSALRANELLNNGKLYLLIPAGRLNSFITEPELQMLRSGCKRLKMAKRRRDSKVLPADESRRVGNEVSEEVFIGQRMGGSPMWKPVLEPIYEQ